MAEEPERANATSGGGTAAWAVLGSADRENANRFLDEQTLLAQKQQHLVDLQAHELQHELSLRHWSLRVHHISDVLKLAFELAAALVVLAIAVAAVAAVWAASHAEGVVIEAFGVPPALAARGLTGQTIAAQIEDRLAHLQAETVSIRAANSYAENWGNEIKVEIPDTGISVSELYRDLCGWLGHETHITGEVWQGNDGEISIVARSGSDEGRIFSGTDLDSLIDRAAEAIYADTQPYRYALYLVAQNRIPAAIGVVRQLAASGSPNEQPWADGEWGNLLVTRYGDWQDGLAHLDQASIADPALAPVWDVRGQSHRFLDREEDALHDVSEAYRLFGLRRPDVDPERGAALARREQVRLFWLRGDLTAAKSMFDEPSRYPLLGLDTKQVLAAQLHEPGAEARLRNRCTVPRSRADGSADPALSCEMAHYAAGDWHGVVEDRSRFEAGVADAVKRLEVGVILEESRVSRALFAGALAHLGRFADAEAAIARTPLDCDSCLRVRGEIRALERQWPATDYWYAAAVRHAPSIPLGNSEWGNALLQRGDYDAAVAEFREANLKAPHFADPLEMWGEALIAKNRSDLALAKFAEANKYAPNWGRLHLKWSEALLWSGDKAGAAKQFAIAAGLDLSAPDKAQLVRMTHG